MKSQSISKEIVRQPDVLIWYGNPSDHSGAYHVILTVGLDGIPVEVGIENPDSCRLEIPGLIDSGWDPKPEEVVADFFESAKTCRPKSGVYFNNERINTIEEFAIQLGSFCSESEIFFNDPSNIPSKMESWEDGSLLIYSRIDNQVESDLYQELFDPEEDEMMKKLGARFSMIRQFLLSGSHSEGFIQCITSDSWIRVDNLTDIFCRWLWDSPDRVVRTISDG
ncbi:MAG: hypothetical protein HQK65_17245 [Desulfamplus sp.]|nr:hypothetical protein [Desulfamplus sp.]